MEADMVFILLGLALEISSHCSGLKTNQMPLQEIVQDQRTSPEI